MVAPSVAGTAKARCPVGGGLTGVEQGVGADLILFAPGVVQQLLHGIAFRVGDGGGAALLVFVQVIHLRATGGSAGDDSVADGEFMFSHPTWHQYLLIQIINQQGYLKQVGVT